jgi:CheY-like chemotaxis protein
MAKVLIVDDDPGVVSYLSRVLTLAGHAVVEAVDGMAGLAAAADPSINLIISDLNMPGDLKGVEFIRRLRQERPDCPVVVVSGYPSETSLAQCREMGVTEFLTKPFEMGFIRGLLGKFFPPGPAAGEGGAP